jgi:hypothetical protein
MDDNTKPDPEVRAPRWVLGINCGTRCAGAESLLLVLWTFRRWGSPAGAAFVYPSVQELVAVQGRARSTITTRLEQLVALGWIRAEEGHDARGAVKQGWRLSWKKPHEFECRPADTPADPSDGRPSLDVRPTVVDVRPTGESVRPAVTECLINREIESASGMEAPTPAKVTVDRPSQMPAGRHNPPGEPWVDLPDEISIAVGKHPVAWQEAMRPNWCRDLALVVGRLGLSCDDVVELLTRWGGARDAARARGTFEQQLRARTMPSLTELWWKRSEAWLLAQLEIMRGVKPIEDTSPEVSRSAEVIEFRARLRGEHG